VAKIDVHTLWYSHDLNVQLREGIRRNYPTVPMEELRVRLPTSTSYGRKLLSAFAQTECARFIQETIVPVLKSSHLWKQALIQVSRLLVGYTEARGQGCAGSVVEDICALLIADKEYIPVLRALQRSQGRLPHPNSQSTLDRSVEKAASKDFLLPSKPVPSKDSTQKVDSRSLYLKGRFEEKRARLYNRIKSIQSRYFQGQSGDPGPILSSPDTDLYCAVTREEILPSQTYYLCGYIHLSNV